MQKKFQKNLLESKYYGVHACLEIWKQRKEDIVRVYVNEETLPIFSSLLKWCAANKKAYHIVPDEELNKVSDSIHHEGIILLVKNRPPTALLSIPPSCSFLIYLDGVENPHNVGSILRTCSYFGVKYLLGKKGELPALSASSCRIAKGGCEHVSLIFLESLEELLTLKKKGYQFIATSSHKGSSLYSYTFPKKSILLLGAEDVGLSSEVLAIADTTLMIPGTGKMESLNVSVASSLFIGEQWRQTHQ